MPAKLNDEAAQKDQRQSQPGGARNRLPENEFTKQDGPQSKEADINAKQFGKIPFDRIHHQPITGQCRAAQQNPTCAAAPEAMADDGIAAYFQYRRNNKKNTDRASCRERV